MDVNDTTDVSTAIEIDDSNPDKQVTVPTAQADNSEGWECSSLRRCYENRKNELELREKLQILYSLHTLPKVAWFDQGIQLPLDKYFVELQISDSNKQLNVQDIFKAKHGKKPVRILVDGQPGFGKTTLALKLAFDWANGEKYMDFKFLFYLPLRLSGHRGIEDAIEEIGRRCNFEKNEVSGIVNKYQNETLFLLDGWDEMVPETRHDVMKMWYKIQFEKVTIVLFCRTGSFKLSAEQRTRLFGIPYNVRDISDKHISILGITNEHKKLFLRQLYSSETVDKILKCISLELELFASPLFLMMLAIVTHMEPFSTKTVFYKQLFNSIIKHSFINRGQPIEDSFDLFRVDSTNIHPIQQIMCSFGKLCAHKLDEGVFIFESADLTYEIYKIGLLTKQTQTTFVATIIHYEPFHVSLMEFMSAFSL